MIEIVEIERGWELRISGHRWITSYDRGVCERYARIVARCRELPYRAAIKTLMEDIGYSEEVAKGVYIDITEHRNTGTMQ